MPQGGQRAVSDSSSEASEEGAEERGSAPMPEPEVAAVRAAWVGDSSSDSDEEEVWRPSAAVAALAERRAALDAMLADVESVGDDLGTGISIPPPASTKARPATKAVRGGGGGASRTAAAQQVARGKRYKPPPACAAVRAPRRTGSREGKVGELRVRALEGRDEQRRMEIEHRRKMAELKREDIVAIKAVERLRGQEERERLQQESELQRTWREEEKAAAAEARLKERMQKEEDRAEARRVAKEARLRRIRTAEEERVARQEQAERERALHQASKKADHDATTEWRRTMLKEKRDAERRQRQQAAREREEAEIRALEDEHSQRQARQRTLADQSGVLGSPPQDRSRGSPRKLTAEV